MNLKERIGEFRKLYDEDDSFNLPDMINLAVKIISELEEKIYVLEERLGIQTEEETLL